MEEDPLFAVLGLPPAQNQRAILNGDREIRLGETSNRQRYPKPVRGRLFNIIRWISIISRFRGPLDESFQLIKPQQMGMRTKAQFCHQASPLTSDMRVRWPRLAATDTSNMGSAARPRKPLAQDKPVSQSVMRNLTLFFPQTAPEFAILRLAGDSRRIFNRFGQTMNAHCEMNPEEVARVQLEVLRREHRDLDAAIAALQETGRYDMLMLKRLKKQKLSLKDQIARIEDLLLPDIIA